MKKTVKKRSPISDLKKALRDDCEYYRTWKANLCMAFIDEHAKLYRTSGIHEIAEKAAVKFLHGLMSSPYRSEKP